MNPGRFCLSFVRWIVTGAVAIWLAGCATMSVNPPAVVLNRTGITPTPLPAAAPPSSEGAAITARPVEPPIPIPQREELVPETSETIEPALPELPVLPSEPGPQILAPTPEPADVELLVKVPPRKPVGSGATFALTVINRSSRPAGDVVVACEFNDPFVFPGSTEKRVVQRLGELAAGEHREIALTLSSSQPGTHCARFTVTVAGIEALWKSVCVDYVPRELELAVVGPTHRTVGSRAEFNIQVVNVSPAALSGIRVAAHFDAHLLPREITTGGQLGENQVLWDVGELQPGEGVQLQIEFETASPTDRACLRLDVTGPNLPDDQQEHCLTIVEPEGPLLLEVADTRDPLKVGTETEHVITLRNRGNEPLAEVELTVELPEALQYVSTTVRLGDQPIERNVQRQGQRLRFEAIDQLPPGTRVEFRVRSKALEAGHVELRATATSRAQTEPLETTEPTTAYR